jgi:hypothetical protein
MNSVSWLLLLYALPTQRNAERVNLWRKLKKFGAVQLRTSGYVLPEGPPHLERLQWLSKQIQDAGGEASLIRVAEIDGVSGQEVVDMFNDARASDYKEVAAVCQEALTRYKKKKAPQLASELAKLNRRFQEIKEIDYFNSPAAHDAQMLLGRVEKALALHKDLAREKELEPRQYVGRTWLTRPRPGIDRAGSAWLIRKFIDPNAAFLFGMDLAKQPMALPFDMADVELSHHGEDCTFETLVKRFGIDDRAVLKVAEMVHDADLEDGKFGRCECIGISCVLDGWARAGLSDQELLAKGMECFEGLYRTLTK